MNKIVDEIVVRILIVGLGLMFTVAGVIAPVITMNAMCDALNKNAPYK